MALGYGGQPPKRGKGLREAVIGLIGAVVGGLASLAGTWFVNDQQREDALYESQKALYASVISAANEAHACGSRLLDAADADGDGYVDPDTSGYAEARRDYLDAREALYVAAIGAYLEAEPDVKSSSTALNDYFVNGYSPPATAAAFDMAKFRTLLADFEPRMNTFLAAAEKSLANAREGG